MPYMANEFEPCKPTSASESTVTSTSTKFSTRLKPPSSKCGADSEFCKATSASEKSVRAPWTATGGELGNAGIDTGWTICACTNCLGRPSARAIIFAWMGQNGVTVDRKLAIGFICR